ncbi:radical SAM protein [Nocardia yamanashiensis]|uniref:radical SAM protein n=1 Tax=Nocardia yamanashiensis TaxID=209247 RepID=UPI000833C090|nr:radical SAM protein [Nocardia yamanashiensis]
MTITTILPAPAAQLRRRFVYRPELRLLYDTRSGLEHRLNDTAGTFVDATFVSPDPVAVLAGGYRVAPEQIAQDLAVFWFTVWNAPQRPQPRRRSGDSLGWAQTDVPFPLALEVELTRMCNWHCGFCYNVWKVSDEEGVRGRSDTGFTPDVHMSLTTAHAVIQQAAEGKCLRMRFSGGEPTLHPDYREIVAAAASAGMDVELFTNGIRMTAAEARRLVDVGLRVALFSVHGLDETHNAMARNPGAAGQAWRGMRAAVAAGLTTVAEALVCADNLHEMPELTRRLVDLGVSDVSFMPYVPVGPADPRRPVLLAQLAETIDECTAALDGLRVRVPCAPRHCLTPEPTAINDPVRPEFDNHCAAGLLWASVSYDGMFRHCPHSSTYAGAVGDGLARLWRERMVPTVRRALAPAGACAGCGQLSACGGGCHLGKVRAYPGAAAPGGRVLLPLAPTGASGCGR